MRSVSLDSLYDILVSKDETLINMYSRANMFELKEQERSDYICLIESLMRVLDDSQKVGFFIGQKTNSGIGEEFDMLRYSNDSVVNIEIKHQWPQDDDKCLKQLLSHERVLRLISTRVYCYTYIVDTQELFILCDDAIIETDFDSLSGSIESDFIDYNILLDVDFSVMLVSPYSDTQKFYNHEYLLAQQQEEIKKKILSDFGNSYIIKGRAGTGKSLLLMDLARYFKTQGKKVLVLLCRNCPDKLFLSRELDLRIEEIKNLDCLKASGELFEYDVIMIDEAQRIRSTQLDTIRKLSSEEYIMVYALDPMQTLNDQEVFSNSSETICNLEDALVYELSHRIRSNEAIDSFSRRLIQINCDKWTPMDYSCVNVSFFSDENRCVSYLKQLYRLNYEIIEPTPYTTKTSREEIRKKRLSFSKDPHSVLGEEFDNVAVLFDEYIIYKDVAGKKIIDSSYPRYYPYNMNHCIYEAVTRAKKSLEIVILNNPSLYKTVCEIKEYKSSKT